MGEPAFMKGHCPEHAARFDAEGGGTPPATGATRNATNRLPLSRSHPMNVTDRFAGFRAAPMAGRSPLRIEDLPCSLRDLPLLRGETSSKLLFVRIRVIRGRTSSCPHSHAECRAGGN